MPDTLSMFPKLQENTDTFVKLRHDIHANPELGFDEVRTADIVAGKLRGWGYEVETGIGGTGIAARLRNGNGARSLGLRADMDALPILESSGVPWISRNPGVMHACGHDGHTAILLAAAEYLAATRRFDGTLNLIFQPAEEMVGKEGTNQAHIGGAVAMIQDGLFTRFPCDHIFALHNGPGLPVNVALACPGLFMASSDRASILLRGVGGHGALPHMTKDPTIAAASIVMALQSICARNLDPDGFGVVTVGVLKAGTAANIIPDTAELLLNVRAKTEEERLLIERRIREIVAGQAASFGVTADIDYLRMNPVLRNDEEATLMMQRVLADVLGEQSVIRFLPKGANGSEDFAWMLQEQPGCYFVLGNGCEGANGLHCHHPGYDFNDSLIPIGASIWVRLAETYLH